LSISTAVGGNYEDLDSSDTATLTISDTIDTTTVTLTASSDSVMEGEEIIYTAEVDYAPQGNLVITLNDTAHTQITILSGALSGSSIPVAAPEAPDGGTTLTVGIATTTGGNYEDLDKSDTAVVIIGDYTPEGGTTYATVDDDGLAGGIAGGIGDYTDTNADGDNNEATFSGTLQHTIGGDGYGSVTFADMDTLTGMVGTETVTYSWSGDTLTATGPRGELFNVEVDPTTGEYTVTLVDNVLHTAGGNENDAAAALTYTVMDADGSEATGTLNVTFDDDMPLGILPDNAYAEDDATNSNPDVVESLNFITGADGVGTAVFTGIVGQEAMDTGGNFLVFEGEQLYLQYGSNGTDLTLLEARTAPTQTDPDGKVGFYFDIDPAANTYAFHSNGIISNGTETTATDLDGVGGGNPEWKALIDIGGTTDDVMLSTATGESVNTNNTQIGISEGNSIESGEGIRFDFVNNLTVDTAGDFHYDGTHNEQVAYRQVVDKVVGTSANLTLTAIVADDDDFFYNDTTGESLVNLDTSMITVYDGSGQEVTGLTITDNGDSITINGLQQGWTFELDTVDQKFSAIQIDGAAGTGTFKLGFFSYGEDSFGTPIELQYAIQGIDGDGDTTDGVIHATMYPDGGVWTGTLGNDVHDGTLGDDILLGDGGDDTLSGGDGDDILAGGIGDDVLDGDEGNDTLYGGSGADTIDGGAGDDYIDGGSGDDTIVFDAEDSTVDGGLGYDTLEVAGTDTPPTHLDFSNVYNIEKIDMDNGIADQEITLTMDDVLNMTGPDGGTLEITGDATDEVTITYDASEWNTPTVSGGTYTFISTDTIPIQVDIDPDNVTITPDIVI
jgi:hypothetical protein